MARRRSRTPRDDPERGRRASGRTSPSRDTDKVTLLRVLTADDFVSPPVSVHFRHAVAHSDDRSGDVWARRPEPLHGPVRQHQFRIRCGGSFAFPGVSMNTGRFYDVTWLGPWRKVDRWFERDYIEGGNHVTVAVPVSPRRDSPLQAVG